MRFEGKYLFRPGVLDRRRSLIMTKRLTGIFLIWLVGLLVPLVSNGQRLPKDIKKRMDEAMILVETAPDSAMAMSWQIWEDIDEREDLYLLAVVRSFLGYQAYHVGDSEMSYMNFHKAFELLVDSDTLDPYNLGAALDNLAVLCIEFEMHERAIEYFETEISYLSEYLKRYPGGPRSEEIIPHLRDAKFSLSTQFTEIGHFQQAEKLLEELLVDGAESQAQPTRGEIMNEKGIIKEKTGDLKGAILHFNEVFESDGSDDLDKSIACHNLGDIYSQLNMWSESEKWFQAALDRVQLLEDAESIFLTSLDFGEALFVQGRVMEAIGKWKFCLQELSDPKTPDLFIVYNWLDKGYKALGRDDLAETYGLLYDKYKEGYDNSIEVLRAHDERAAFESLVNSLREEELQKEIGEDYFLLILIAVITLVPLSILVTVRVRRSKQKKLYQKLGDILLEDD